ncbi:hypothetical protein IIB34_01570 [PVC group bacterium]|nr:hypothetical protein [PVC group bacterium]
MVRTVTSFKSRARLSSGKRWEELVIENGSYILVTPNLNLEGKKYLISNGLSKTGLISYYEPFSNLVKEFGLIEGEHFTLEKRRLNLIV